MLVKRTQWKIESGSFSQCFLQCIEGKLGIYLLLMMYIEDDSKMVYLMIIYIEKTIGQALNINDIINKIMGMSARWVQIPQWI